MPVMLLVVCDAFNVINCSRCFRPTATSFALRSTHVSTFTSILRRSSSR